MIDNELKMETEIKQLKEELKVALAVIGKLAAHNSPLAIAFLQRYRAHHQVIDSATINKSTAA